MNIAVTVAQLTARATGIVLLVLGLLFWTGHALQLIPLHQAIGVLLVVALLVLAGIGLAAGARRGIVVLVAVWAVLLPVFGMMQTRLLPGPSHWVIRVLHLAVGIAALRFSELMVQAIRHGNGGATTVV